MKNNFVKIITVIFVFFSTVYFLLYFVSPSTIIDVYRGQDEATVFIKFKFLPFKKEISSTNSYKFKEINWSPNKKHFAFLDFTREEVFEKDWSLQVFDLRTFNLRTVYIGDTRTSRFEWINDELIRVYRNAGSGVRVYRDINIDVLEPFVVKEYKESKYWIPEKTF